MQLDYFDTVIIGEKSKRINKFLFMNDGTQLEYNPINPI